jgi:hypothetical protein
MAKQDGLRDLMHAAQNALRRVGSRLENLSHRMSGVGFDKLAEECAVLAKVVQDADAQLSSSIGHMLTQDIARSHASSENMLRACLAGAVLAAPDEESKKTFSKVGLAIPYTTEDSFGSEHDTFPMEGR